MGGAKKTFGQFIKCLWSALFPFAVRLESLWVTRVELIAQSVHDAKADPKRALVGSFGFVVVPWIVVVKAEGMFCRSFSGCVQVGHLRELLGLFGVRAGCL